MRLSSSITLALNVTYLDLAVIQRLFAGSRDFLPAPELYCSPVPRERHGKSGVARAKRKARKYRRQGGSMGILSLLRSNWFWIALIAVLYSVAVVIHGSASYDRGYATARAEGDAALLNLQLQHSNELAKIAEDNFLQFQQQVTRANQAEARFLSAQDQFTALQQQLSERIAHVSTQYRPAPGASLCLLLASLSLAAGCGTTTTPSAPICPRQQPAELPPALKKRPGPPPALTPNYWKAVSARLTSWPMPAITGNGLSPTWRN